MKSLLKAWMFGLGLSLVWVPSAMAGESAVYQRAGNKFANLVGKNIIDKYGKINGEIAYDPASDGFPSFPSSSLGTHTDIRMSLRSNSEEWEREKKVKYTYAFNEDVGNERIA